MSCVISDHRAFLARRDQSNTPLIEPAHRLFVGDDATGAFVRETLLYFLPDVNVVLNVLERSAIGENLKDLLDLFLCRFQAGRILRRLG